MPDFGSPNGVQLHGRRMQFGVAVAVMGASLIYLWQSIKAQVGPAWDPWIMLDGRAWAALIAGSVGTLLLGMAYHVVAVHRLASPRGRGVDIAAAYALGQIARYIPGKIVGLWFQLRLLKRQLPATVVLLALAVQTSYDYAWAIAFCLLGMWMVAGVSSALGWLLLGLVCACVWLSHRQAWCERLLVKLLPSRWKSGIAMHVPLPLALTASVLLFSVWLPLLGGIAWALHGTIETREALLIGLYYILAALGSLLVFVVPSGLALREAMFVWMGRQAGLDPALLVLMGVAIRISLTIAEVILAAAFGSASMLSARLRLGAGAGDDA